MSYHIFPNLGEILQGDLVGKLREGIVLKDFLNRECNCISTTKVKGECAYEGGCRACCIVYKVTCKKGLSLYVGKTQNTQKKEWNNISNMWHKKYTTIKILILLQLTSLTILTKNQPPQQCREIMKS